MHPRGANNYNKKYLYMCWIFWLVLYPNIRFTNNQVFIELSPGWIRDAKETNLPKASNKFTRVRRRLILKRNVQASHMALYVLVRPKFEPIPTLSVSMGQSCKLKQLGVPNRIVKDSNSEDEYDTNLIPTTILSWWSRYR